MSTAPAEPGTIDTPRLLSRVEKGEAPTVIDVRSPAEFEAAHIPGAVSIPVDVLGEHREQIAPVVDEGAVLVCQAGPRAQQAREHLVAAGQPGLRVLAGGMNGWQDAGAPVQRGAQTWPIERQVRFTAGSIVLAGILGSLLAPRAKYLAGAIGGGLVFSAATDTCAMGNVLARMPWNRSAGAPRVDQVVGALSD